MKLNPRFAYPTSALDMGPLLRRLYWWSLGISLAFHLALITGLTTATRPSEGDKLIEPAKVKFFTRRAPMLSKPMELRKVPQPKRQLVRREVQVSAARMDQVRGRDFWQERLKENHPVFTAFFDIRGGMTSGMLTGSAQGKFGVTSWNYLTGYFVKGRLVAVSPGQGWGWDDPTGLTTAADATRQIQMAVNIIIYALTQEGSMTQRLMQMVN